MRKIGTMRTRRGLAGAAAALAALAATGDTASAATKSFKSGPIEYVRETAPAPADALGNVVAACPTGSRLAGGGGFYGGAKDEVRIGSITPLDLFDPDVLADDAYLTETYNAGVTPRTVRSFATCLRNGKGGSQLAYVANNGTTINQGQSVGSGATVNCAGGRVVGGGILIPGLATTAGEERLNSSHPRDANGDLKFTEGWGGSYNISNSSVTRTPQARAVCMPGGVMRTRHRFSAKVAFPGITNVRTACTKKPKRKNGWRVVGGGVQGFFERIVASVPFDSKDNGKAPDNGWRGQVRINPQANPQALLVHAICVKKL